jgi:thymidylate synthase (FAD)
MKVTLVDYTQQAARMLVLAKNTRLDMNDDLLEKIGGMDGLAINEELQYIANTVPSSWEFVHYTFLIQDVSRAFTHQFVRTRTGSFAQQTMRVNDMSDFGFIWPEKIAKAKNADARIEVNSALNKIKDAYYLLVNENGIAPEDARSILPTNISTNILASFNLRSLSDLIKSRSGGRTQKEYRAVVKAMADAVQEVHPWAEKFFYQKGCDYFAEIEEFAEKEYGDDLKKKGELLKIVDKMRKG